MTDSMKQIIEQMEKAVKSVESELQRIMAYSEAVKNNDKSM